MYAVMVASLLVGNIKAAAGKDKRTRQVMWRE